MALYHFTIKTSENSKASATLHHEYICREGKYDYISREGKFGNNEKAAELVYKEHGNMPAWAKAPSDFWQAAYIHEAGNRTSYREIELALPVELEQQEQLQLVQQFVSTHLGKSFVYSLAVHSNEARLAKIVEASFNESGEIANTAAQPIKNPHVHIMFCERRLDGIERDAQTFFKRANSKNPELGGAPKDRCWNGKHRSQHLSMLRESWAEMQNKALEKFEQRVDHRSLKAQHQEALENGDLMKARELDRMPEQHVGPKGVARNDRGKIEEVIAARKYRALIKQFSAAYFAEQDKAASAEGEGTSTEDYKAFLERVSGIKQQYENKELEFERYNRELLTISWEYTTSLQQKINSDRQQHANAVKKIMTETQIKATALSAFTYGDSVDLHKEFRNLWREEKNIKERDQELKDQVAKGEISREVYALDMTKLSRWKGYFDQRKEAYATKANALQQSINLPAAQAKLRTLESSLVKQNQTAKQVAAAIQERIHTLRQEKEKIESFILTAQKDKHTMAAVEQEQLRIANREKLITEYHDFTAQQQQGTPEEISVSFKKLIELCDERLKELREQAEPVRQSAYEAGSNQNVISPERAYKMALSVFSKGESKLLNSEERKLIELEQKLAEQERELQTLPKPGLFDFSYKKEYEQKVSGVRFFRDSLTKRRSELTRKKAIFTREIQKPATQQILKSIQEGILEKNRPQRELAESLWARFNAMKKENEGLIKFRKTLYQEKNSEQNVRVKPSVATVGGGMNLTLLPKDLLNQADNILRQISSSANTSYTGLKARLREDDDERKLQH